VGAFRRTKFTMSEKRILGRKKRRGNQSGGMRNMAGEPLVYDEASRSNRKRGGGGEKKIRDQRKKEGFSSIWEWGKTEMIHFSSGARSCRERKSQGQSVRRKGKSICRGGKRRLQDVEIRKRSGSSDSTETEPHLGEQSMTN